MGSYATPPDWVVSVDESEGTTASLGDVLSGRFEEIDIDSVAAVREERERK
jgi:hypothetical protein